MKRAFVVSDLHLGGAPGFQMCPERNQIALATLLASFARQRSADVDVHVILAGDVVDFLAESPHETFTRAPASKLDRIFEQTAVVWDALAGVVRDGCTLTVMLGNHDIELALPDARARLLSRLGPGRVALHGDGTPLRLGSAIVCHGNLDDEWNYVDYERLNQLAGGTPIDIDEMAVPGSELVTSVMNLVKRDHPWVDLLKPETSAALPLLAVLQPSIVVHLPRVAALYAKTKLRAANRRRAEDDIAAPASAVERDLALALELAGASDDIAARGPLAALTALWRRAAGAARTAVRRRMRRALRAFAPADYFFTDRDAAMQPAAERLLRDHRASTVICGHTHLAKRVAVTGGQYLNTGTWADLVSLPPETWLAAPTDRDEQAFDHFIDDLAENRLGARRKLLAVYACVEYGDDAASADLRCADGRRVDAGNLMTATQSDSRFPEIAGQSSPEAR